MEKFVDFMSGTWGQSIRVGVGAVLAIWAVLFLRGVAEWVVVIIGLAVMIGAVMRYCILNLLVGRKLSATPKNK